MNKKCLITNCIIITIIIIKIIIHDDKSFNLYWVPSLLKGHRVHFQTVLLLTLCNLQSTKK